MKSKSKSTLRTVLTLLAVLVVGAAFIVMLLSFFDNSLNGVLRNWFYNNYMMKYYDQAAATSYIEPDWDSIKGLAVRLALAAFAIFAIAVAVVSHFRLNAERRRIGNAVGRFMLDDVPDGSVPEEIAVPLSSAKFELMRSQRLLQEETARKNDLVMYLAHDLKTPLASVIGYLTLLRDERELSPELQEKYLSITLDKAERLEDLINEFFEITRFNLTTVTLERSRIDLARLLEQLRYEFMPMLSQKHFDCTLTAPETLPIYCDAGKIQRVFDNLLRNAVLYGYPDTEIRIDARLDGDNAVVSVANSGATIPEEKLRRIFEQFYRLDAARSSEGGTGLGLAIANQIVQLHGGTINARSADETVEFTVTLPVGKS